MENEKVLELINRDLEKLFSNREESISKGDTKSSLDYTRLIKDNLELKYKLESKSMHIRDKKFSVGVSDWEFYSDKYQFTINTLVSDTVTQYADGNLEIELVDTCVMNETLLEAINDRYNGLFEITRRFKVFDQYNNVEEMILCYRGCIKVIKINEKLNEHNVTKLIINC